jgi:REP element-mobilizing transposase RayT
MTSPPALSYDTYYHLFNRGVNRANIFIEERNYAHFLSLYARYIEPVAETFAYCLLRNHFHLLARIKSEKEIQAASPPAKALNPSGQFSRFFNAYAKAINKAYGRTGSLFHHPFGRVPVMQPAQFYRVVMYIHQNPQKHRFVEDFREWKYSSYGALCSGDPTRLQQEAVMAWFGGRDNFIRMHADWISERESAWFAADDQP